MSDFPPRPSLEQLRKRAKERRWQDPSKSLADTQFDIARESGFETWAALKHHMECVEPYRKLADATSLASVAKQYGFASWEEFEASFTVAPPFYRIDRAENSIDAKPLSDRAWEGVFQTMRERGIDKLNAGGQMTDAVLARLSQLDFVTSLNLEGSRRVTDHGLKHLARMQRLRRLNLTQCSITDRGLAVLRQLPELREFFLYHHGGVSDEGLSNLEACHKLVRVDLLGSNSGDGTLRALAGKEGLKHFKSGDGVTDAGLVFLHEFPLFACWRGGQSRFALMDFDTDPNFLLLRGQITDAGMRQLAELQGLFALNLDDSRLSITAAGVRPLEALPHLEWLAFDATDSTMPAIAALPHLRFLMCQDTTSTDAGFIALSQSRTLEYLWGRRCYGLTGPGFVAMSRMPALRGLSVSCKNVADAALATLPDFPSLVEFMPMDVQDDGFRHVGRCTRLEELICMYCRDTGDVAMEHIAGLALKNYYAGYSQITDRSLEILSRMDSLERLTFEGCAGVTDAGIAMLARLPALRELSIGLMGGVTRAALRAIPAHVRVRYEP